jgi:hypothetical protein
MKAESETMSHATLGNGTNEKLFKILVPIGRPENTQLGNILGWQIMLQGR